MDNWLEVLCEEEKQLDYDTAIRILSSLKERERRQRRLELEEERRKFMELVKMAAVSATTLAAASVLSAILRLIGG